MKKNILLLIVFFTLIANSQNSSKDYVTFSGKILNSPTDELLLINREFKKKIPINADGTFSDTLKVKDNFSSPSLTFKGKYILGSLYLKNGFNVHLEGSFIEDHKNGYGTYTFTGDGAAENNFFLQARANYYKREQKEIKSKRESFEAAIKETERSIAFLNKYKNKIDESLYNEQLLGIQNRLKRTKDKLGLDENGNELADPLKGKPAPVFTFENYKGGTTSLTDFKGKYVYIDLWATWCAFCLQELPYLQKIEKEYHDKNIVFVSISQDIKNNYEKWRKMIEDKNMGGVQLISFGSRDEFYKFFNVKGIPRFILIDPAGNVVSSDAPRPSFTTLKELLDSLPI